MAALDRAEGRQDRLDFTLEISFEPLRRFGVPGGASE